LDLLDWNILELLQDNCRQTYTEIGRRLNVAHTTVYDRIKRMEKSGVIKKYGAIIEYEKAGINHITAVMTVFTDPKESENIAQTLARSRAVLEVSTSLSEELSVIAKVVATDQNRLHTFIAQDVAPLPGVLRIRTSILSKQYKDDPYIHRRQTE
jgi:DNA-binding Lrp family transcriptional regulator